MLPIGWEIKSYGTAFQASSYLDVDKQGPNAYLDGNSWMANRFTDRKPMLYVSPTCILLSLFTNR